MNNYQLPKGDDLHLYTVIFEGKIQRKKPPAFCFISIIRIRLVRTVQEKLSK